MADMSFNTHTSAEIFFASALPIYLCPSFQFGYLFFGALQAVAATISQAGESGALSKSGQVSRPYVAHIMLT